MTCRYCGGLGVVWYHGGGQRADLRACSICDDGRTLARQVGPPNVTEVPK